MKLSYFILWLAGGGLVALETYIFWNFLQVCESRHEAAAQELWDILVHREGN